MWLAADLAQAKSPRSGERSTLTQVADSRSGETATEGLGGYSNAHLGETTPRLGQKCSDMLRLLHVLT